MHRRTRIVATLGPATDRSGVLESLLEIGLDVARINFSHGNGDSHRKRIARLREAARNQQRIVAVLADLPGPKLRAVLSAPLQLARGQEVTIAADDSVRADIHVTEPEVITEVVATFAASDKVATIGDRLEGLAHTETAIAAGVHPAPGWPGDAAPAGLSLCHCSRAATACSVLTERLKARSTAPASTLASSVLGSGIIFTSIWSIFGRPNT